MRHARRDRRRLHASRAAVLALAAALGCGGDQERDVEMVSGHGSTRSHFPDTNCMSCHQQEDGITEAGDTPGFFTIAGSVRATDGTPHPDVTVILYDALFDIETRTPGEELARVEADALGMFYTTDPLPEVEHHQGDEDDGHHSNEIYFPAVLDEESGVVKHMYYGIGTGSCNMCHYDRYMDMSPLDDVEGDPYRQEL